MTKELEKQKQKPVSASGQAPRREVSPSATLRESEDGYVMRIGLPGVEDSDLQLTVEGSTLALEADTRYETPEGFQLIREECPPVCYKAVYEIPDLVQAEAVKAQLKDGVLIVELPKREEVKPRKIAVKAG